MPSSVLFLPQPGLHHDGLRDKREDRGLPGSVLTKRGPSATEILGRTLTTPALQCVARSQSHCYKFKFPPQLTGAVSVLIKTPIFRFHTTLRAFPCLAATPQESRLCLQDSSSALLHILSCFPASWLLTPITWLFGPNALHFDHPLTSLLSSDSDLTLADEPSRTIFPSLLSAAPLHFTLSNTISSHTHPPPKLYLCAFYTCWSLC